MASNTKTKSPPQGFRRGFLLGAGTNPKQKNIQGKTASNTDTAAAKAALLARPASHAPTIQTIADSSLLEVETTLDVNHKNCATDDNFSPWRILAPVGATHATTTRDSKWTQHLPMAARITVLDDDDDDTELDELTDRNDPYHASTTTLRDNPSSNAVRNWNFLIEEEEDERHGPMEQSNGPLWTTAPAAVRELRHDSSTAPQQKLEFGKPVLTDGSTPLGNESHVRERFETPGSDESETRSAPIVRSVTSNGLGPVPVVDADGIVRSHVRGALDRMRCSRKRHWTSIGQTMLLLLNSKNMVPEINNRKDELSILLLLWGCLVDEVVVAVASASGSSSAGTQYFETRRQQQDPVLWLGLFVLDDCMKRVCSTSPLVRGSNPEGLLWTQIFFVPTETPETMPSSSSSSARSRRLGAINLLDLWLIDDTRFLNLPLADGIIQWNPALTTVILEGLVNHVLPCFINAALLSFSNNPHEVHASSPGKEKSQTILERRRVAVMYRLVAVVATRIRDSLEMDHPVVDKTDNKPSAVTPAISLVGAFWEKVEMMDQVFDAQRDWLLRCCSVPPHLAKGPLDFDWSNLPTNDIRFRCKAAVLADWRHVIKECRELNSEQGTDDKVKEIRWLCDCLIGPRSSLGSFQRSMSLSSGTLKIDDIFSVLESVNEPNTKDQTHADTKDRFLSNHDTTRNCLRGLVGWIAQHCKHLKRLALRDNIRLTMWVLEAKYRSNCGSSVEMVSVILKSLWSRSNGIPPDFFRDGTIEKSKNVPESFALITASISDTRVQNHSDALAGFLLQVAARCVLGNDDALVDQLIANAAECSSSFDILLIVEQLLTSDSSEQKVVPNTDFGRDHFTVSLYTMMLQNFMIVPSVREAVRIDISRFNRCSVVTFAPPLLRLLAGIDGPLDLVDENILLKVLANALNSLLQNDSKHSLEFLIQALNDGVKSTHCSPKKEKLLYSLCSKLGLTWRKSLLSESESFVPNQCFAQVLLCLGEELFRNPSEMTSLLIFGCVAGQPSDYLSYDIRFRVIATKVATELLQLSLDSMTRQRDTSLPASDDIFLRLAPLLLLRRIPSLFFRCAIHDSVISSNFCSLISDVGKELAARLDISDDAYQRSENAFTADERLLSAEIAAFLLPFDDLGEPSLHGTSCYTLIFSIAFEKLANHLNTNECDSKTLLPFIRSGKVALRVVYTALSLAKESDRGSHLVSVATSALQLLSFGPAADIEFCELQDGCVDFLAFCLKRFLHTQMPHTQQEGLQFACLRNETTSVAHSLRKVWDTVKCAIKTGDFTSTLEQSGANFAASSRDQYWRPILLLCQRCNEWELKSFARLNILWIVNFLTSERYRLIQTLNVELSGLLQTVFVILTTTKSFEFFGGSESSRRQNCRKLFLFVVETLNKTGSENCEETYGAVKLAALTVFLSMVIIDVGTSESQQTSFSNDSEVTETLALIKKLAVSDPDERVRQTSNRVFAVINRQCLH